MLRIPYEPPREATANGDLGDVDHILLFVQKVIRFIYDACQSGHLRGMDNTNENVPR